MGQIRRSACGQTIELWPARSPDLVVLLHGFTGTPAAWSEVAEKIAGRAYLAAPALPGHDPAGMHPSGTFLETVERLAAAVSEMHPGPWRVAGYSLGGRLALALLLRHPDVFASGVLIGASAGLRTEEERRDRRASDARWAALLRERGLAAFLPAWERQPLFATQRELPAERFEAQRKARLGHRPELLASALEVLGLGAMPDLWPELPSLASRVHFGAGELDAKFSAIAEEMAAAVPGAPVTIVPGVGHNVVLEAPAVVADILLATSSWRAGEPRRDA